VRSRNNTESEESPGGTAGGWFAIEGDLYRDPVVVFAHGLAHTGHDLSAVPEM
jgi:hypothetical protein